MTEAAFRRSSDGWFCRRCSQRVNTDTIDVDYLMAEASAQKRQEQCQVVIAVITAAIVGSIATSWIDPLNGNRTIGRMAEFAAEWVWKVGLVGFLALFPAFFVSAVLRESGVYRPRRDPPKLTGR
jgi:hypothetical protein